MRVQYFGVGFYHADCVKTCAFFESLAQPEKTERPLTFKYHDTTVQISEMGYLMRPLENRHVTLNDFYRAICIEMSSEKPTITYEIFASFLTAEPEIGKKFESSSDCGYPFINLPEKHLGTLVKPAQKAVSELLLV